MVELLLVVAILSILAVVILTVINPIAQIQKANDARRKEDLTQLQKVLEQYYNDHGRYPYSTQSQGYWYYDCLLPSGDANKQFRINTTNTDHGCMDWGTTWTAYKTSIPKDPSSSYKYAYNVSDDGQTYYLYAHLERGFRDQQNCCPAAQQVDGCRCVHASSTTINDSSGDLGDSDTDSTECGYSAVASNNACNFGVSSPNTKP